MSRVRPGCDSWPPSWSSGLLNCCRGSRWVYWSADMTRTFPVGAGLTVLSHGDPHGRGVVAGDAGLGVAADPGPVAAGAGGLPGQGEGKAALGVGDPPAEDRPGAVGLLTQDLERQLRLGRVGLQG